MKKILLGSLLMVCALQTTSLEVPTNAKTQKNISREEFDIESTITEPNIGLSAENRAAVGKLLNALLADEFAVYVKTLNYHWNVESPQFKELHALFKDLYEKQFSICDDVAERIRSLGEVASGTMQEFTKNSKIKEQPGKKLRDQEMIKNILQDIEAIIATIRVDAQACVDTYGDAGTNNFLLNLLEQQEKTAWMLRASLAK